MGYKLGSNSGKAIFIKDDKYFDINLISNGDISSNSIEALSDTDKLSQLYAKLNDYEPSGNLSDINLGPPLIPKNVFAVGLNYKKHAEESNLELPPFPMIFTKHSTCISGPKSDICMKSDMVDYEAELVFVIGKGGKDISKEDAWDHVAGLCAGQDISDRPVQFHATPPQFNLGKSFDTFGPIGPYIVSTDLFNDKESLKLQCWVNDELRQETLTNDLIFDTSGTEKLRIHADGEVHISDRNSANAGEHFFQAGAYGIRMNDTNSYCLLYTSPSPRDS